MQNKNAILILLTALFAGNLAGCSSVHFPGVFKIDIGQGNIINEDMIAKLKPGMTKHQVLYVMGSPMVQDTYAPDRWDYFYSLVKGKSEEVKKKHLILYFKGEELVKIEGDANETTERVAAN
ncbi:MAG TPA: outer membrane protein assembly factor BamE [Pseudomonadales bacterium]|nr:outer membrane protein assembly factor BamE [Pseudomonadales bacterium]